MSTALEEVELKQQASPVPKVSDGVNEGTLHIAYLMHYAI